MNIRPATLAAICAATLLSGAFAASPGSIVITQPWVRATQAGMPMTAGYLTIENRGKQADTLIAIATPVATTAELHRTIEEGGMSRMRPTSEVTIAAGETVKAGPGGLHLMLKGLREPLAVGAKVPLTLMFRQAGTITVQMQVMAATYVPDGMHSH